MNSFKVDELQENASFKGDLLVDKLFLLEPADAPAPASVIAALKKWEFSEVLSDGGAARDALKKKEEESAAAAKAEKAAARASIENETEEVNLDDFLGGSSDAPKKKEDGRSAAAPSAAVAPAPPKAAAAAPVAAAPAQSKAAAEKPAHEAQGAALQMQMAARKAAESLASFQASAEPRRAEDDRAADGGKIKEAIAASASASNDRERMAAAQRVYNCFLDYIDSVYTRYAARRDIDKKALAERVAELRAFIGGNRQYMMRVAPHLEGSKWNMIVLHAMRATMFGLIIGMQLRMAESRLVELGVACVIHEIGMLRLPPQLYTASRKLTAAERKQMATHTVFGYEIAKKLGFPLSVQLGILEHHENMNGAGYPRHLQGGKISLNARIIAVACSYEAITAPRSYKSARSTFEAMVEMLKNQNRAYDDTVIKALLYSLSLFPIGAYVYLSNGKIAQVVDVNPGNPKNPVAHIMGEKEADGSPKIVQTNDSDMRIVRVLSKKELSDAFAGAASR